MSNKRHDSTDGVTVGRALGKDTACHKQRGTAHSRLFSKVQREVVLANPASFAAFS
jgi:hypothetical protein